MITQECYKICFWQPFEMPAPIISLYPVLMGGRNNKTPYYVSASYMAFHLSPDNFAALIDFPLRLNDILYCKGIVTYEAGKLQDTGLFTSKNALPLMREKHVLSIEVNASSKEIGKLKLWWGTENNE